MEAQDARSEVEHATHSPSDAAPQMGAQQPQTPASEDTGPRPLSDIRSDLQKPIPERLLETRRQGGQEITYVPWYRAQKILDHYTRGFWEYEVVERTFTDTRIMLTVRLIVHTAEGAFHREGTGIEALDVDSPGDPQSNAESMAFRRAAAKWGLGLDLYEGGA